MQQVPVDAWRSAPGYEQAALAAAVTAVLLDRARAARRTAHPAT